MEISNNVFKKLKGLGAIGMEDHCQQACQLLKWFKASICSLSLCRCALDISYQHCWIESLYAVCKYHEEE